MPKPKITKGMLGGRKKKSVEEIEKAVSEIHEKKTPKPKPKVQTPKAEKPKPKRVIQKPVRFSLDINKSTHLKFKIYCMENETTMKDEILKFIEKTISRK